MSTSGRILRSARSGIAKAKRDVRKAERFLAHHHGKMMVDDPFWGTVGYDISVEADAVEAAAWSGVYSTWQHEWQMAHPLETMAAQMEANARTLDRPIGTCQGEIVTIGMVVGPEGEALIDRMATEHGHEDREDECPAIQIIRQVREQYLTEVAAKQAAKE